VLYDISTTNLGNKKVIIMLKRFC